MTHTGFEHPDWYRALTLRERIAASHRSAEPELAGEMESSAATDHRRAEQRLRRWREDAVFGAEGSFDERLAMDGIGQADLFRLLGASPESLRANRGSHPDWLIDLETAFSTDRPLASADGDAAVRDSACGRPHPFVALVAPLVIQARRRLRQRIDQLIRRYPNAPFDSATAEALLAASLPCRLDHLLGRTLVLELHVARLGGQLDGATPEARFESFAARLRDPEIALAILREYPVLARDVVIRLDHWVAVSIEFLTHLAADASLLVAAFTTDGKLGHLTTLDGGLGDGHRGGRSVLIAGFASGVRIVYKPRSLCIEAHFQELLSWLNARGDHPSFRNVGVLNRRDHGWVEVIAPAPCTSREGVTRFYQRLGGLLAVLHALAGTDVHGENLIAAGEHPVIVDLETLFHPSIFASDLPWVEDPADLAIDRSVLRSTMLPHRSYSDGHHPGIDLSGLGATAGQRTAYGVPTWKDIGSDTMRLERERAELIARHNNPTLNGAAVDPLEYRAAFIAGFTALYRLIAAHRDELLASDGPIARFADDEVRVVMRPTRAYAVLLREAAHPDVLRDGLERERLFNQLWSRAAIFRQPAGVIAAEREDLLRGDVPHFATRPSSRDLHNGAGTRVPNALAESGLAMVSRQILAMGESDLERQRWFIDASLTTLSSAREYLRPPRFVAPVNARTPGPDRFLAAARSIGDRLAALAYHDDRSVGWVGVVAGAGDSLAVRPLGLDLYDGLPGIGLFLAELGARTGEQRYTELAEKVVWTVQRRLEDEQDGIATIGAFEGWAGLLYLFARLGSRWGRVDLLRAAERIVPEIAGRVDESELDVILGAAGAIGGLLALHAANGSPAALAVAERCGDHLLTRAARLPDGLTWPAGPDAPEPSGGFAHGADGMAWALLELAARSGRERFRQAALDAMRYQRAILHANRDRFSLDPDAPRSARDSWCWGATGTGLAWLRLARVAGTPDVRRDVEAALSVVERRPLAQSDALCHGVLGNIDVLLQAADLLDEPRWRQSANRIGGALLASAERTGWRCSVPLGVETPGLMTGLAGIGYGLLRLAAPANVPSVLTLDLAQPWAVPARLAGSGLADAAGRRIA